MDENDKENLIKSLEKVEVLVKSGLAPASMSRIYNQIMEISNKYDIEAWRLNGFYYDFSELTNKMIKEKNIDKRALKHDETIHWFKDETIYLLLDKWKLRHDIIHDIFPYST